MSAATPLPFRRTIDVRFRDIDALGVGHHTLPLIYFEEARAAWWRDAMGRDGMAGIDYILAEIQVRYHAPVRWPDVLEIALGTSRIGEKSFELEYEARSAAGALLASGRTVQVMYDYAAGAAKSIPPGLRDRLDAFRRER